MLNELKEFIPRRVIVDKTTSFALYRYSVKQCSKDATIFLIENGFKMEPNWEKKLRDQLRCIPERCRETLVSTALGREPVKSLFHMARLAVNQNLDKDKLVQQTLLPPVLKKMLDYEIPGRRE